MHDAYTNIIMKGRFLNLICVKAGQGIADNVRDADYLETHTASARDV